MPAGPPKPHNVTFTADLKSEITSESVVEAFLQWNVSAYDCNRYYVIGNLEYFVTIWPPLLDGSTLYSDSTSNKSLALSLTYDQEYSIAVITANCVGNSTPANISIGEYYTNLNLNL